MGQKSSTPSQCSCDPDLRSEGKFSLEVKASEMEEMV